MYTGLLDHPEFQFTDSDGGVHDAEFKELDELAKEARLHGPRDE